MVFLKDIIASNMKKQDGNVLLLVFFAVALLGILTVSFYNQMSTKPIIKNKMETDIQAQRIMGHAFMVKNVVELMVAEGTDPANLDSVAPSSDTAFNTAPHTNKIYHPYGGGAEYRENYAGWTSILVHDNADITNVGATTASDIMLVGLVDGQLTCERINALLFADSTLTEVPDAILNNLKSGSTAVSLDDGTNCTGSCDARAFQCLTNTTGDEFLYYHVIQAQ